MFIYLYNWSICHNTIANTYRFKIKKKLNRLKFKHNIDKCWMELLLNEVK